jgi:hypothetical protein
VTLAGTQEPGRAGRRMSNSKSPLLSILVACAAGLAHMQLKNCPEYAQFSSLALLVAIGVGESGLHFSPKDQDMRRGMTSIVPRPWCVPPVQRSMPAWGSS